MKPSPILVLPLLLMISEQQAALSLFSLTLMGLTFLPKVTEWFQAHRWVKLVILFLSLIVVAQFHTQPSGIEWAASLFSFLLPLKLLEATTKRDQIIAGYIAILQISSFNILRTDLFATALALTCLLLVITYLSSLEESRTSFSFGFSTLIRVGLAMFIALPLIAILFLAFPRLRLNLPSLHSSKAKVGFSEGLQPGQLNSLFRSDKVAFHIEYPLGYPSEMRYYLGALLTHSKGLSWYPSPPDESVQPLSNQSRQAVYSAVEDQVEYTLYLTEILGDFIFTPLMTASLSPTDPTLIVEERSFTFRRQSGPAHNVAIKGLVSGSRRVQWPLAIEVKSDSIDSAQVAEEIALSLRKPADQDTVFAIENYFKQNDFIYSLEFPKVASLDEFILSSKTGTCEHFAGATATLLRFAGVPAHVVVGYLGGEANPVKGVTTVRDYDAHAWVTYFDRQENIWKFLDPTNWIYNERIQAGGRLYYFPTANRNDQAGGAFERLREYLTTKALEIETFWLRFLLNYDLQSQKELLKQIFEDPLKIGKPIASLLFVYFCFIALYRTLKPRRLFSLLWQRLELKMTGQRFSQESLFIDRIAQVIQSSHNSHLNHRIESIACQWRQWQHRQGGSKAWRFWLPYLLLFKLVLICWTANRTLPPATPANQGDSALSHSQNS